MSAMFKKKIEKIHLFVDRLLPILFDNATSGSTLSYHLISSLLTAFQKKINKKRNRKWNSTSLAAITQFDQTNYRRMYLSNYLKEAKNRNMHRMEKNEKFLRKNN